MHVPVDDRHALEPERRLRVTGGARGTVEEAEPHRPLCEGVMPGRPGEREAALLDRLDRSAGGKQGRLEARLGRRCVEVEVGRVIDSADQLDVLAHVYPCDLVHGRRPGLARGNPLEQSGQPLGRLRMEPRRMEARERRMADRVYCASAARRLERAFKPQLSERADASAQLGDWSDREGRGAEASRAAIRR